MMSSTILPSLEESGENTGSNRYQNFRGRKATWPCIPPTLI